MKPKFPIISIYNNGIDILKSESNWTKATVLAVLNGKKNSEVYDANGQKWNFEFKSDEVSNKFITRFLANTIYNPIVDVKIEWTILQKYTLEELRNKIYVCIDQDDDILTQFIEADFLKKQISESSSFKSIFKKLNKYVFNVVELELWNDEQE